MRRSAFLLVLLASCGEDTAPDRSNVAAAPSAQAPPSGDSFPATPEDPGSPEADGAADVARAYFGHIGAGRYDDAWRLRWPSDGDDRAGFDAFAAHFDRYQSYRAQVGPPRPAQETDGSVFVDVPVQLYGRLKNGDGFGSAGMVTLRRKNGNATDAAWRVYSGE